MHVNGISSENIEVVVCLLQISRFTDVLHELSVRALRDQLYPDVKVSPLLYLF